MSSLTTTFSLCFRDTATPATYTLSLHDALPISKAGLELLRRDAARIEAALAQLARAHAATPALARTLLQPARAGRSEEHTSELQSLRHLVCRLLLEKKKKQLTTCTPHHNSNNDK